MGICKEIRGVSPPKAAAEDSPCASVPKHSAPQQEVPNPKLESSKSTLDAHIGQEGWLPPLAILCLLCGAQDVVGLFPTAQVFLFG